MERLEPLDLLAWMSGAFASVDGDAGVSRDFHGALTMSAGKLPDDPPHAPPPIGPAIP
jgi:hypothetical protein